VASAAAATVAVASGKRQASSNNHQGTSSNQHRTLIVLESAAAVAWRKRWACGRLALLCTGTSAAQRPKMQVADSSHSQGSFEDLRSLVRAQGASAWRQLRGLQEWEQKVTHTTFTVVHVQHFFDNRGQSGMSSATNARGTSDHNLPIINKLQPASPAVTSKDKDELLDPIKLQCTINCGSMAVTTIVRLHQHPVQRCMQLFENLPTFQLAMLQQTLTAEHFGRQLFKSPKQ